MGLDSKESVYNAGDPGSILGPGKSLEKRDGYPLQDSCLKKSMDRRDWWITVHGA